MNTVLFFIACAYAFPVQSPSHGVNTVLNVQVVDNSWRPLPGTKVRVTKVASCSTDKGKRTKIADAGDKRTSELGAAEFGVEEGFYMIAVGGQGNFEKKQECVDTTDAAASSASYYVQFRLGLTKSMTVY
jgi:uncharacterized GH25 family protein